MTYPKPFRIETPPPTLEATAKKFGLSDAKVRRLSQALQESMQPERNRQARAGPTKENVTLVIP